MNNILKTIAENEETFFPWSYEEHPPLDAKKDFVNYEKELREDFREWASL